MAAPSRARSASNAPPPQPPPMRLSWLLGALGLLFLAAACCAYLCLCLLFLQGQWQLLYHPEREVPRTPASLPLPFSSIPFAPDDAGKPQLTGWWVPAGEGSNGLTVLYLHDGSGSLSDTLPAMARQHALGCNVFAMDYRGFGGSAPLHPSERTMVEDARSALTYLEETRHLRSGSIVLWGTGIGATIAAEAASGPGPHLGGAVFQDFNEPALALLAQDPRSRLLPLRLLLRDRLDPTAALQAQPEPKLFLAGSAGGAPAKRGLQLSAISAPPVKTLAAADSEGMANWLRSLGPSITVSAATQ